MKRWKLRKGAVLAFLWLDNLPIFKHCTINEKEDKTKSCKRRANEEVFDGSLSMLIDR